MKNSLVPVVYTMGKVASSSVSAAIDEAGLHCYDIHSLDKQYLIDQAHDWLSRGKFPTPHFCVSMAYRNRLLIKKKKCLYISLVREPIARNMSAFFQNLHNRSDDIRDEENAQKLFNYFMENYPHHVPQTWFEQEFAKQLDIDVFSHDFDRENKYVYIESENTLIFRVDCPDEVKSRVLSDILEADIQVKRENDSSDKKYVEAYDGMKTLAHFSEEFVTQIYSHKFAQHFWTPEELEDFRAKWTSV